MSRHWSLKVAAFLAALVVCIQVLWAQNTTGVHGVVTNASGAPVTGAFVKLKNEERRLTFMVISQAEGRYTATDIPAGKYVVQGIGGDIQSEKSSPVGVSGGGATGGGPFFFLQTAPAPAWGRAGAATPATGGGGPRGF